MHSFKVVKTIFLKFNNKWDFLLCIAPSQQPYERLALHRGNPTAEEGGARKRFLNNFPWLFFEKLFVGILGVVWS